MNIKYQIYLFINKYAKHIRILLGKLKDKIIEVDILAPRVLLL